PIKELKSLRVGVVFSGGPAAGGHNCLWGLYEGIKKYHKESSLVGFLSGPSGIIEGKYKELDDQILQDYYNEGGFDCLGSGRTKIETKEQFEKAKQTIKQLALDALVVIGGDDTNTNAALLAEYLEAENEKVAVIGIPKTIDGDMRGEMIEASFGFDSAAAVYAELLGNIARDAISSRKYYHFVKIMGRTASHLALECALAVQPNLTFIGEEVQDLQLSIKDITDEIVNLVEARAKKGIYHGVIVFPEGLIEFIPEMKSLIKELNALLAKMDQNQAIEHLSAKAKDLFLRLPQKIQQQLLIDRDSHGNVQVSLIETEKLFLELSQEELGKRGSKFSPLSHFFGYEGRCCLPTNFDATYCFNLGLAAAHIAMKGVTGYIVAIANLTKDPQDWIVKALPLARLIHFEMRKGVMKTVIEKKLVDVKGLVFKQFMKNREECKLQDCYINPGPIQFFGPAANKISSTLIIENQKQ
ncbi:MAG: diphosphate--fructose-6-phosphate 1-phosphotransferase, partial [Chlamydiae bacterium]|nr:diphosphate--fructose-6-phosphate 1-phosphotransferase [Chlamydiota bacterium]